MSADFDWIVEYETLPPDSLSTPNPTPPSQNRRRPRWLWPALVVAAAGLGALIFLWTLGGKDNPLPNPDPPQERLEAAVRMEISALLSGDETLYARVQDASTNRTRPQPAPEPWFAGRRAGGPAGPIELLGFSLLDADSARADVRLTWNDVPYHLTWFYRLQGERWLHTDWQDVELGPTSSLSSPHLKIEYHQDYSAEAVALAGRVKSFISSFCQLLPCPAEPFTATLKFNRYWPQYHVGADGALSYRIPAPLRVRWPADHQPEPLVLASIGRHLAEDLYLRHVTRPLDQPQKAALELTTYWLAHDLLGADPLPATNWLDQAVAMDGQAGALSLISDLAAGLPVPQALLSSFRPETLADVTVMPDHFAWLIMTRNLIRASSLTTAGYMQASSWGQALDWSTTPWTVASQGPYALVAPVASDVRYMRKWAIVSVEQNMDWQFTTYFFRPVDGGWEPGNPYEELTGLSHTLATDLFSITYWDWDEPYLQEVVDQLTLAHRETVANFNIATYPQPTYVLIPTFDPAGDNLPSATNIVPLVSPTNWQEPTELAVNAAFWAVGYLLGEPEPDAALGNWTLVYSLRAWQVDQLVQLSEYEPGPRWDEEPTQADTARWLPLDDFWSQPAVSESDWGRAYTQARLVIDYVLETYGREKISVMLQASKESLSMTDWVVSVTGQSLAEFEKAWHNWLREKSDTP